VLNGRLYFAATNAKGRELWVTDGTAAGTKRISDINPGAGDAKVQLLTKVGSRIVFFADDGTHGVEPWTYAP
jgi:ELWxxDGT repeat protein